MYNVSRAFGSFAFSCLVPFLENHRCRFSANLSGLAFALRRWRT